MNPTTTTEHRAPRASYCSPDAPMRFMLWLLALATGLALAFLPVSCGSVNIEACASAPSAQAVCR